MILFINIVKYKTVNIGFLEVLCGVMYPALNTLKVKMDWRHFAWCMRLPRCFFNRPGVAGAVL